MRKTLLLLLLVVSGSVYSQIEFLDTTQSEVVGKISYVYLEKVGENDYNFFFKNINSVGHEYVNFSFKNVDNDIDKLYNGIMQGFTDVPRDPLKMKANGQIVWLKYVREDGEVSLQLQMTSGDNPVDTEENVKVSRWLTQDDVKNLFKK